MIDRLARIRPLWLLAAIMIVSTSATILAMRRTSTTFDEIVLMSGGARGFATGNFSIAPEHPPLMQYIYGLPIYLAHPNYPKELKQPPLKDFNYRYQYARHFFWKSGNDGEHLAFLGRLPAALCVGLLALVTFLFARRMMGDYGAVLAAALVAFLPDVLAHGGVAYNDLPLALTYLLSVWMLDRLIRDPSWRTAVAAGASVALAFGVKFSAVALIPIAMVLVVMETIARGRDVKWLVRIAPAVLLAMATTYLALVLIYRGDFSLREFEYGLDFTFRHASHGHAAPSFLLGKFADGFWYFFPVAFLYKTPAALHLLGLIAAAALLKADFPRLRRMFDHPHRAVVIAAVIFTAALLSANLNIGFRYALPLLPLICVLIAAGVTYMWEVSGDRLRVATLVLVAWFIISPLSYYPNFLAYISEYGPGRNLGREVVIDSSLDWGQGLVQLRDYMRAHKIDRVYLSYFGSAMPDGYGVDYSPLLGFIALEPSRLAKPNAPQPTHVVISATHLQGGYFIGDPYAKFRQMEPEAVVAHTMYVYRIQQ